MHERCMTMCAQVNKTAEAVFEPFTKETLVAVNYILSHLYGYLPRRALLQAGEYVEYTNAVNNK